MIKKLMLYKLSITKSGDRFIERVFHQSMKDLGKFYSINWTTNMPKIVFLKDRKSKDYYHSLIKHELSHLFYKILSAGKQGPVWLSEGVAIYTSGQNKLKTKP